MRKNVPVRREGKRTLGKIKHGKTRNMRKEEIKSGDTKR